VSPAERITLDLVRSGQTVSFVARGGSMWPTIPSGTVLEIVPCAAAALRQGEVAAFERNGTVVVHRVVRVGADAVRFRGDALPDPDGDIPFERVLGRARLVHRRPLKLRWPRPFHLRRALRAAVRLLCCRDAPRFGERTRHSLGCASLGLAGPVVARLRSELRRAS
jgi:hypothetical protein